MSTVSAIWCTMTRQFCRAILSTVEVDKKQKLHFLPKLKAGPKVALSIRSKPKAKCTCGFQFCVVNTLGYWKAHADAEMILQHKYNLLIYYNKRQTVYIKRFITPKSVVEIEQANAVCQEQQFFAFSPRTLLRQSSTPAAWPILSALPNECTKHIRPKLDVCRNCSFIHIRCRNRSRNSVDLYFSPQRDSFQG